MEALPGADLIKKGLEDCENNVVTVHSLLIDIGRRRLEAAGLVVPDHQHLQGDAEFLLYELIQKEGHCDPYSCYNALLRRLISFEQALEHLRI